MTSEDRIYITRCKMFEQYVNGKASVAMLCSLFGISRTWFYKLYKRWRERGEEGLRPSHNKSPDRINNKTPLDIEVRVLDYIQRYPTYGPQRVSDELARPENGFLINRSYGYLWDYETSST